jgi:hypothetical protein
MRIGGGRPDRPGIRRTERPRPRRRRSGARRAECSTAVVTSGARDPGAARPQRRWRGRASEPKSKNEMPSVARPKACPDCRARQAPGSSRGAA